MRRFIETVFFLVVLGVATLFGSNPKPTSAALPMYPERARMAHVAGIVKLWFVLNDNREVSVAGTISGNPLLRDAALRNVKTWKFPAQGTIPKVRYETEFVYRLGVQQKQGEPKLTISMEDFRRVEVISELSVQTIE